ncbi:MAG: vitamin K epoxide reductase [Planctomycetales bacterium]|nr:vitamin K epoxide reductase [Planctomycetales bacterium]
MNAVCAAADELDVWVKPYHHNPSAWRQRVPICLLAFAATGICFHMSLYQWGFINSVWDPVFGEQSNKVLKSDVARNLFLFIGIHDAATGGLAYLGDAILGLAGSTRRWQYRPWMVILFGIDVIPLGVISAILVGCQAFIVGNWCFPCLVTAAISLILVYWAWDEVRVSLTYLWRVYKASDLKMLWLAFCGYRRPVMDSVAAQMVRSKA